MATIKRTGRCICGLLVALHYDRANRKLSCEDARAIHPRASLKRASLLQQFSRLMSVENDNGKA